MNLCSSAPLPPRSRSRRRSRFPMAAFVVAAVLLPMVPAPAGRAEPTAKSAALQEGFAFELRDLSVPLQGGNSLTVSVQYGYRDGIRTEEYPDFRLLARACEDFFANYPDKKAYWEVLNKELTALLLERFPALKHITVEIRVAPTSAIPYARSSRVTRSRDGAAQ